MLHPNKTKWPVQNSCFKMSVKLTLNGFLLRMLRGDVVVGSLCVYCINSLLFFFSTLVNSGIILITLPLCSSINKIILPVFTSTSKNDRSIIIVNIDYQYCMKINLRLKGKCFRMSHVITPVKWVCVICSDLYTYNLITLQLTLLIRWHSSIIVQFGVHLCLYCCIIATVLLFFIYLNNIL